MFLTFRNSRFYKLTVFFELTFFCLGILANDLSYAQIDIITPPVQPALTLPSLPFNPPELTAIKMDPEAPFNIEFLIQNGDDDSVTQAEGERLIKYFLALLTIPEDGLWINLSFYEPDRIPPEKLSRKWHPLSASNPVFGGLILSGASFRRHGACFCHGSACQASPT
jgi:hypothetical protein